MSTTNLASTASAITDEQKALAAWVRDGIADFAADNWPMKKYSLEEIEAAIRAIEINIPAKFAAPTTQPAAKQEEEICGRCGGSGDQEYLVGGGPDAHDEIGPCSGCGGSGVAAVESSQPASAAPTEDALDACRALVAYDESDDSDAFAFMQRYADAVDKARAAIAASTKGTTS